MPLILRVVRKPNWDRRADLPPKIQHLPADAIADLATKDNALSVWQVEDDQTNFEPIVAALAATRDQVSHFDYVLLPMASLTRAGFHLRETEGETLDEAVNRWHRDITGFTASRLFRFAHLIFREGDLGRVPGKDVLDFVVNAVRSRRVDLARWNARVQLQVEQLTRQKNSLLKQVERRLETAHGSSA